MMTVFNVAPLLVQFDMLTEQERAEVLEPMLEQRPLQDLLYKMMPLIQSGERIDRAYLRVYARENSVV